MGIFNRSKTESTEASFDAPTTAVDDISGDYTLDVTHTRLGFSVRHAMVTTVRGSFKEFEGTAKVDTANPANSSVRIVIKAASIDTNNADRDGHLQTGDFFEAGAYPDITFTSTKVERQDADTWLVTGDLTIKEVTKPVTVEFEQTGSARDPFGNLRIGFEGAATINRKDWGLTYNAALETGGVLISEKAKLEFDVSAIQTA
ncbi:YceI family protein [Nocardioides zeae]|uniref:YceI family protein n=1 Tax=Nocardioides imazamoxiresistens TaxID=3231893 RepID=A0ABU3PV18_9ACTN|nr:YceI family protein [Nocardioides zeae]MDT9593077.1 YceI family protein [Nocardioides zeae]